LGARYGATAKQFLVDQKWARSRWRCALFLCFFWFAVAGSAQAEYSQTDEFANAALQFAGEFVGILIGRESAGTPIVARTARVAPKIRSRCFRSKSPCR